MCLLFLPSPGFPSLLLSLLLRPTLQASLLSRAMRGVIMVSMLGIWLGLKGNLIPDFFSSPGSYFGSNSTSLSNSCGHPDHPLLKNREFQERLLDPAAVGFKNTVNIRH